MTKSQKRNSVSVEQIQDKAMPKQSSLLPCHSELVSKSHVEESLTGQDLTRISNFREAQVEIQPSPVGEGNECAHPLNLSTVQPLNNSSHRKLVAFTLAEVLITLGIIGIVAAMTLPNLVGNYKKKVTVSQLKKVYTTLSQMVITSQADNGPVQFGSDTVSAEEAKTFFETYWLPYFNAPQVSEENVPVYGQDYIYKYLSGSIEDTAIKTNYNGGRIHFSTQDGVGYFIIIMKWDVKYDADGNPISMTAKYNTRQDVYVDLNGTKRPNAYGKDVFRFVVNFASNTVRPLGHGETFLNNYYTCSPKGVGLYCAAKIMDDGWEIKDDYPW